MSLSLCIHTSSIIYIYLSIYLNGRATSDEFYNTVLYSTIKSLNSNQILEGYIPYILFNSTVEAGTDIFHFILTNK